MKKKNSNYIMLKMFFIFSVIGALTLAGGINKNISRTKNVVLNDGEVVQCFKTKAVTIDEFLNENNIDIKNFDIVKPALSSNIEKEQSINIVRAKEVFLTVDGNVKKAYTCKETIKEFLEEEKIKLGKDDNINYNLNTPISEDMDIKITRVEILEESLEESIPFEIKEVANSEMNFGVNKLVTKGVEGVRLKKYSVEYHDGEEIGRTLINEEIKSGPVNEVVEYGTLRNLKTSRGEVLRYTKVLNMKATAYDLSYESCGKKPDHPLYGITYTGMKAKHGVVAVDPNTIPLYTRLYIEAADGSWVYGNAIAGDIGGAVKGNKIDLFYDDEEFVDNFGVKNVKVYILK